MLHCFALHCAITVYNCKLLMSKVKKIQSYILFRLFKLQQTMIDKYDIWLAFKIHFSRRHERRVGEEVCDGRWRRKGLAARRRRSSMAEDALCPWRCQQHPGSHVTWSGHGLPCAAYTYAYQGTSKITYKTNVMYLLFIRHIICCIMCIFLFFRFAKIKVFPGTIK